MELVMNFEWFVWFVSHGPFSRCIESLDRDNSCDVSNRISLYMNDFYNFVRYV